MLRQRPQYARGYSLIEMMVTILIITVISTVVLASYGNVERTQRLTDAATQVKQAVRYARMLSMSGANTTNFASPARYGVAFDLTNQTIWVFQSTNPNAPIASGLYGNGQYLMNLKQRREMQGVTITASTIVTQSGNVRYIVFNGMGAKTNLETVTLSYGAQSVILTLPMAGDVTTQWH